MLFKLSLTQTVDSPREKIKTKTDYSLLYYVLTGLLFGGVLVLSALNDFLFFGWLSVSTSIVFGLLSLHLLGNKQVKK